MSNYWSRPRRTAFLSGSGGSEARSRAPPASVPGEVVGAALLPAAGAPGAGAVPGDVIPDGYWPLG